MSAWERFDYGGGLTIWQRECPDCDRGLLLAPARFCPRCGGSGYLTADTPQPVTAEAGRPVAQPDRDDLDSMGHS